MNISSTDSLGNIDESRYNQANNGKYPLRNAQGESIPILGISPQSQPLSMYDRERYPAKEVKPFLSKKLSEVERANLYKQLKIRVFTESDKQSPHESGLVGQLMVVADQDIPQGTCLGIYGGKIFRKEEWDPSRDDSFTAAVDTTKKTIQEKDKIKVLDTETGGIDTGKWVETPPRFTCSGPSRAKGDRVLVLADQGGIISFPAKDIHNSIQGENIRVDVRNGVVLDAALKNAPRSGPPQKVKDPTFLIDGDNILSKMNSTFEYGSSGVPIRQKRDGYNVRIVPFEVETNQESNLGLPVAFTTKTIKKGEELRWDYGYDSPEIRKKIAFRPQNTDRSIKDILAKAQPFLR